MEIINIVMLTLGNGEVGIMPMAGPPPTPDDPIGCGCYDKGGSTPCPSNVPSISPL